MAARATMTSRARPAQYQPLDISQSLPATPLRPTPGVSADLLRERLPRYRLNLLACHGDAIYFVVDESSVAEYEVSRACGVAVVPVATHGIIPATSVNNVRVGVCNGVPRLFMTGSAAGPAGRGSLSVLGLHGEKGVRRYAETMFLPLKSAWGLDVHDETGHIAISSNSHCAVVVRLLERDEMEEVNGTQERLERVCRVLSGTHFSNIPCVRFSRSGELLASASIDGSFALFDLSGGVLEGGRRLHQSAHDSSDGEWCWFSHWLDPRTVKSVARHDPLWACLAEQRATNLGATVQEILDKAAAQLPRPRMEQQERHHSAEQPVFSLPVYDDSAYADYELIGRQAWIQNPVNQATTRPVTAVPERVVRVVDSVDGGVKRIYVGEHSQGSKSDTFNSPLRGTRSGAATVNANGAGRDDIHENGSLLVVGKQETMHLFRVRRHAPGTTDVEELDQIRLVPNGDGRMSVFLYNPARLCDMCEVPELNLLVVTQQNGVGVALIRVVEGVGFKGCKFVLERVIEEGEAGVIGTCVMERDSGIPFLKSFELFIVRTDGTIESWDIGRAANAFDASICST